MDINNNRRAIGCRQNHATSRGFLAIARGSCICNLLTYLCLESPIPINVPEKLTPGRYPECTLLSNQNWPRLFPSCRLRFNFF